MLHLENNGYVPKDASMLLRKAREQSLNLNVTVRDSRVSSKYVEYDVSINKEKLNELVEKLQIIGSLDHAKHVVEEKIEKNEAIKQGIFYFNNERYWECHEVLEGVWNNCHGKEKKLVNGLILVAAALVHYQKAEDKICLSILGRAQEKISKASGIYYNIDVDGLREKITFIINSGHITTFEI